MVPHVKYFRDFSTDLNKQSLKRKLITSSSNIEKHQCFLIYFKIFTKNVFFYVNFSWETVFCQHISSIPTNEVSNEMLWYSLTILIKKGKNKVKMKLGKLDWLFFYENKTAKNLQSGEPMPKFLKYSDFEILGFFFAMFNANIVNMER